MRNKRIVTITGGLAIMFLFAGCVEGLDGGITLWNFISLGAAFAFGYLDAQWTTLCGIMAMNGCMFRLRGNRLPTMMLSPPSM